MSEDAKLILECTLGKKSHLNMAGKIVFLPLVLFIFTIWVTLDFLFAKKDKKND